jgi:hypothetical protein
MRGFDPYLVSRVSRAAGDCHYFDDGTLRWFDAYGGATYAPTGVYPHVRVIVESVRDTSGNAYGGARMYRAIVVTFYVTTRDHDGRTVEAVSVDRTGVMHASSGPARRDARELSAIIAGLDVPHGAPLTSGHADIIGANVRAYGEACS